MKWSLFVLDFDKTYDNEPEDGYGVKPLVYLVPTERLRDVHHYAEEANKDFHADDTGSMCIGDYFEEWMDNNGVDYRIVGELELTFEERRGDYLSTEIGLEVV